MTSSAFESSTLGLFYPSKVTGANSISAEYYPQNPATGEEVKGSLHVINLNSLLSIRSRVCLYLKVVYNFNKECIGFADLKIAIDGMKYI